jgi:hypothetical protein
LLRPFILSIASWLLALLVLLFHSSFRALVTRRRHEAATRRNRTSRPRRAGAGAGVRRVPSAGGRAGGG